MKTPAEEVAPRLRVLPQAGGGRLDGVVQQDRPPTVEWMCQRDVGLDPLAAVRGQIELGERR